MARICCLWFSGSLVTDFESDDAGNVTRGLRRRGLRVSETGLFISVYFKYACHVYYLLASTRRFTRVSCVVSKYPASINELFNI